jgi:hypothetical protein
MLVQGRYIVIRRSQDLLRPEKRHTPFFNAVKRLGAGDFMDEVLVYIYYIWSFRNGFNYMLLPDLFE